MKEAHSNTVEVLIATMHRTSLDFLQNMFPDNDLRRLKLLIVNQTKPGFECNSSLENIRVINTYETGLSKSRNLAIKNAIGDICIIADDDVQYVQDFQDIVRNTHQEIETASIIRFKIDTFTGEDYKPYPKTSKKLLHRKSIKPTSSIEITFKRKDIVQSRIKFNTLFGLGSYFKSGEEYLFLRDTLKQGLDVYFENQSIVKHPLERSTSNLGSDNYVKAVSAINYTDFNNFSYLLLIKFLMHALLQKSIRVRDIFNKFQVGCKAINECRNLTK